MGVAQGGNGRFQAETPGLHGRRRRRARTVALGWEEQGGDRRDERAERQHEALQAWSEAEREPVPERAQGANRLTAPEARFNALSPLSRGDPQAGGQALGGGCARQAKLQVARRQERNSSSSSSRGVVFTKFPNTEPMVL